MNQLIRMKYKTISIKGFLYSLCICHNVIQTNPYTTLLQQGEVGLIFAFQSFFDIRTESENRILTFKILF